MSEITMEQTFGRYPLSIIVSFLTETEGCSFLLTSKRWAYQLLPLFRLPESSSTTTATTATTNKNGKEQMPLLTVPKEQRYRHCRYRHKFVVIPVQDAIVRLERLNTRRLYKRMRMKRQRQQEEQLSSYDEEKNSNSNTCSVSNSFYPLRQATDQIAYSEWKQEFLFRHHQQQQQSSTNSTNDIPFHHLPRLLRFLRSEDRPLLRNNKDSQNGYFGCGYIPLETPISTNPTSPSSSSSSLSSTTGTCSCIQQFAPGTTILASYPRCGNTLVRSLLEQVTGIVTGSDTRPDRPLSLALAERHDLVGEGIVSSSKVLLCKTHWPERIGCTPFFGHRVVLLVRNPFDAIESYWNLNVTNTHTKKVVDSVTTVDHADFFQDLVKNEIHVWIKFYQFWLTQSQSSGIPILLVRYEDLIQQPTIELERMVTFTVQKKTPNENKNSINNNNSTSTAMDADCLFWKNRIDSVIASASTTFGYKKKRTAQTNHNDGKERNKQNPKKPSIGRSLRLYSSSLLQELHTINEQHGNLLQKFGYHVYEQGFPNNFTDNTTTEPTDKNGTINASNTSPTMSNNDGTTSSPDMMPNNGIVGSQNSNNKHNNTKRGTIKVNDKNVSIRPPNCIFGRNMRFWRLKHTENDTKPFPTTN